jgi:hypothetical protein
MPWGSIFDNPDSKGSEHTHKPHPIDSPLQRLVSDEYYPHDAGEGKSKLFIFLSTESSRTMIVFQHPHHYRR